MSSSLLKLFTAKNKTSGEFNIYRTTTVKYLNVQFSTTKK